MKLNYKRTFFIGLAFLSICTFWELYDSVIPLMLKGTFKMDDTPIGVIMAADNVLALFLLPFFGALSDKTHTRLGKRMPFIVCGSLISVIFMLLIPIADRQKNLILMIMSLGIVLLAMGAYRSPAVALMPDLTPKPLRSQANAIINFMGTVGGIMTLLFIKFLTPDGEHPNYFNLFLCVAVIMAIAVIMLLITIRENAMAKQTEELNTDGNDSVEEEETKAAMPKEVKRSLIFILASIFLWFTAYNAVKSAFSRYATHVWGLGSGDYADCLLVATGAAFLSYIPIGYISARAGRKKTIIGGIIMVTVSYLCGCFFFEYSALINVVFALTGIGWAAINVNSYPMVVEMSHGSNVGKYTGLYYIISMSAQIMTPILSGFLFDMISYRVLFPYAVVFSIGSLITMLFVHHGDSKPLRKKILLEK